jgi:hypothetical protein
MTLGAVDSSLESDIFVSNMYPRAFDVVVLRTPGVYDMVCQFLLGEVDLFCWIETNGDRNRLRLINKAWNAYIVQQVKRIKICDDAIFGKHGKREEAQITAQQFSMSFPRLECIMLKLKRNYLPSKIVPLSKLFEHTIKERQAENKPHWQPPIEVIFNMSTTCLIDRRIPMCVNGALRDPAYPMVHIIEAYIDKLPKEIVFMVVDFSQNIYLTQNIIDEVYRHQPGITILGSP